jgi:Rrf2 family protein
MLVTREGDYAIRIVRTLSTCEKAPVSKICELETIPFQFAYKILKKLEKAKIVKSFRGVNGGYSLIKKPEELVLYDVLTAIDNNLLIIHCLEPGFACANLPEGTCHVQNEMRRLQEICIGEFQRTPLSNLF